MCFNVLEIGNGSVQSLSVRLKTSQFIKHDNPGPLTMNMQPGCAVVLKLSIVEQISMALVVKVTTIFVTRMRMQRIVATCSVRIESKGTL